MWHDFHTLNKESKPASLHKGSLLWFVMGLTLLFTAGFNLTAYGAGGDKIWLSGDEQTGKQHATASAVDSDGNVFVTGYQKLAPGTNDNYYTVKFKADGSGVYKISDAPELYWRVEYPHSSDSDQALAVAVDGDKNVIVTGYVTSGTNTDIHTIKYNGATGAVIWQHTYNRTEGGNDVGVSIAVDSDRNVYVGGYSPNAQSNDDYTILKYDRDGISGVGNLLWQSFIPGSADKADRALAIAADLTGVAVTGYSTNAGLTHDMLTVKLNPTNGDPLWTPQRYTASGAASGEYIKLDSLHNVVVAGNATNGSANDIYIVKYDGIDGHIIWEKPAITVANTNNTAKGLYVDDADDVYLTGTTWTLSGKWDIFTEKYSGTGSGQVTAAWSKRFDSGSDNDDIPTSIVADKVVDGSGALYVTGYTISGGKSDFQTLKYKKDNGTLLWHDELNLVAGKNARPVGIQLSPAGDPLVAGWSNTETNDYDYYVVKYDRGELNGPTDLGATSPSQNTIHLSWTDNSTNENGFYIERCRNLGCSDFTVIKDANGDPLGIPGAPGTGTVTYDDPGLTSNTYYSYRVRAYKNASPTLYSNYSAIANGLTVLVNPIAPSWSFTYNSLANKIDYANAIAVGSDNNPVATGMSTDYVPGETSGPFSKNFYTVKLNKEDKNVLWSESFDDSSHLSDEATCVAVDGNNKVAVSGYANVSNNGNITSTLYTIRYPAAYPLETLQYDGSGAAVATAVNASNYRVVVGNGLNAFENNDIHVIKYKPDGSPLWTAVPFDGANHSDDFVTAVAFDADGNVFVTGYSKKGAVDKHNFFTAKYNGTSGDKIWWDEYSVVADGDNRANSLAVDGNGDVYVTGYATNGAIPALKYIYTIKYDGRDTELTPVQRRIWEKPFGSTLAGDDQAVAVRIDPFNDVISGNIIVAGTTLSGADDHDLTIIRYHQENGDQAWALTLQRPTYDDNANALGLDSQGNIYVAADYVNETTTYGMTVKFDYLGNYLGATRSYIDGADSSLSNESRAIAVNSLDEVFVAGSKTNAAGNKDFLVYKIPADISPAPLRPYSFTATPLHKSVVLNWLDSSQAKNGFNIQKQAGACSFYNNNSWTDVTSPGESATTYEDIGLTSGSTFCYRIQTTQSGGAKSRWNYLTATTLILSPPTDLVCTAANTTDVNCAWNDTTTGKSGFRLYRCDSDGVTNCSENLLTADYTLKNKTDSLACSSPATYKYKVMTYGPLWETAETLASVVTGMPAIPTTAPNLVSATRISEVKIRLNWTKDGAMTDLTGFRIYRCAGTECEIGDTDSPIATLTATAATGYTYDDPPTPAGNLMPNTIYRYKVRGYKTGVSTTCGDQSGEWNTPKSGYQGDTTTLIPPVLTTTDIDTHTIKLDWTDTTASETGFRIERCSGSECDFTVLDTGFPVDKLPGVITHTDSSTNFGSATELIPHRYRIQAIGSPVPPWPSDFSTQPGSPKLIILPNLAEPSVVSEGQINLTWSYAPAFSPDMTGQQIYRCAGTNCTPVLLTTVPAVLPVTQTNYNDTTVVSGNTYYYQVRAIKKPAATEIWNKPSNTANAEPLSITPPVLLPLTPINTNTIQLDWTEILTSETGFSVERGGAGCTGFTTLGTLVPTVGKDVHTFTDTTAVDGTTYCYRVQATGTPLTPWPSGYSITRTAAPVAIVIPTLAQPNVISEGQINLSWSYTPAFSPDMTGQQIYRCAGTNCTPVLLTTVPAVLPVTQTNYNDTTVVSGNTYYYQVRAIKKPAATEIWNKPSNIVNAEPLSITPPVLLPLTPINTNTIQLDWTEVLTSETGFSVERGGAGCTGFTTLGTVVPTVEKDVHTFTDTTAADGITYCYRVKAIGSPLPPWPSGYSNTRTGAPVAIVIPVMAQPTAVSESLINLEWSYSPAFSPDMTGQQIYRCMGDGCTPVLLTTDPVVLPPEQTTYSRSDPTLVPDQTYYYWVHAIKKPGATLIWDKSSLTPVFAKPLLAGPTMSNNPPNTCVPTPGSTTSVTCSWKDTTTSETGFTLERCTGGVCGDVNVFNTVALYTFNGTLADTSGSGLNLTGPAPTYEDGGLLLNGFFQSASTSILNNDSHTIEFDIKIKSTNAAWTKIFGYTPTGSDRSPGLWIRPNIPQIHWKYDPGSTGPGSVGVTGEGGTAFTIGRWYHIKGIKNGTNLKVYVYDDNSLTGFVDMAVSSPKTSGSSTLQFGTADVILKNFTIAKVSTVVPATDVVGNTATITHIDTTPLNGTQYTYRVRATKSTAPSWNSAYSSTSTVTTTAAIVPVLTATRASETQINLTWTASNGDATGYKVERCTIVPPATSCTDFVQISTNLPLTPPLGYNDYLLSANTTYTYQVKAYKTVTGGSNGWTVTSPAKNATTTLLAPAILGCSATNTTQVNCSWNDSAASESGFVLERCVGAGCATFYLKGAAPLYTFNGTLNDSNNTTNVSPNYAFYSFNNTLNDSSPNGLNLTGTTPVYEDGGLMLTTATSYQSPVTALLDTDYHTIEFDIKIRGAGTSHKKIFGFNAGGGDRSPGLWVNPNDKRIHWRYNPGNSGVNALGVTGDGGTAFNIDDINKWYHIRGVKDGSNFKIYVDGTQVVNTTVSSPKTAGSAALWFGGADVTIKNFSIVLTGAFMNKLNLVENSGPSPTYYDGGLALSANTSFASPATDFLNNDKHSIEFDFKLRPGAGTAIGNMSTTRARHTATMLATGKVLIVGGYDLDNKAQSSAQLYDPEQNSYSDAGSMSQTRTWHTATLLTDGKVLIAGGNDMTGTGTPTLALNSAELYDPAQNSWTRVGDMTVARTLHSAVLLPDGEVLILGGTDNATLVAGTTIIYNSAELYNPSTGSFTPTSGNMSKAGYLRTATLLGIGGNGKVLVAGGRDATSYTAAAELYDPATKSFTDTGSMSTTRYQHTATLLNSGKVLIVAGRNSPSGTTPFSNTTELYDPASGTFSPGGSMFNQRVSHAATLLSDGRVLVTGGNNTPYSVTAAELYDPASNTFTLLGSMAVNGRRGHAATLLNNGKILLTGGSGIVSGTAVLNMNTAELFDVGSTRKNWTKVFGFDPNVAGVDSTPGLRINQNYDSKIIWGYQDAAKAYSETFIGPVGIGAQASPFAIDNNWHHIRGEKSGTSFNVYMDGTLVGNTTVANPKFAGPARFLFGKDAAYDGADVTLKNFQTTLPEGTTTDTITTINVPGAGNSISFDDTSVCAGDFATYRIRTTRAGAATLSNSGGGCWKKRAPITISSSTFLPNFQIKMSIDYTQFSGMQSSFSDMRFFDISGTEIAYWIENPGTNPAMVWIKTGAINNTIYMYYGNSSALSSSNGAAIFDFFDEFNDGVLDTVKWTATDPANATVSDGALRVNTGAVFSKAAIIQSPQNQVFEMKAQWMNTTAANSGLTIASAQSTSSSNLGSNAVASYLFSGGATPYILPFGAGGAATSFNIIVNGPINKTTVSTNNALYNPSPYTSNYQSSRIPASYWSPACGGKITSVHYNVETTYSCGYGCYGAWFYIYNAAGQDISGHLKGTVSAWQDITPTPGIYGILTSNFTSTGFGGDVPEVGTTYPYCGYNIVGHEFQGTSQISYFVNKPDNTELQRNNYTGTWSEAPYLWLGHANGSTAGSTDTNDMQVDWVRVRKYAATPPAVTIGSGETSSCFAFTPGWDSGYTYALLSITTPTPVAPTNLQAVRESETQIKLTWDRIATDETGYAIDRCVGTSSAGCDESGPFQLDYDVVLKGSNDHEYHDNNKGAGLALNTYYTYRVRVYKTAACSWPATLYAGNLASAKTIIEGPVNVRVTSKNTTQVCLAWDSSTSNQIGFNVERCEGPSCSNFSPLTQNPVVPATYCDDTVCNNTTYKYRIKATNPNWPVPESNPSATVVAVTPAYDNLLADAGFENAATGWPTAVGTAGINGTSFDAAIFSDGGQSLKLTASGASLGRSQSVAVISGRQYVLSGFLSSNLTAGKVQCDVQGTGIDSPGIVIAFDSLNNNTGWVNLSETVTIPTGTTSVSIRCFASTLSEGIAYFDSVSLKAANFPLTATKSSESQVNLSWADAYIDEGKYIIERCEDTSELKSGCFNFVEIDPPAPANATTYSDYTAKGGKTYNYRIKALKIAPQSCNEGWSTPYSSTAIIKITTPPPAGLRAVRDTTDPTTRINLSWTSGTTTQTGFSIERRCENGSTCTAAGWEPLATVIGSGTGGFGFQDKSAINTTTYSYQVRSFNEISNSGGGIWNKRMRLNIAGFQPNSTIKVPLNSSNYSGMNSGFTDIRFIDGNGNGSELPYWIQSTSATTANVWVKTGTLDNIYLYYDNPAANSSSGSPNTFFTNTIDQVKGAWSFNEGSGTIANDMSGNGSNLTVPATNVSWTTGKFDRALTFAANAAAATRSSGINLPAGESNWTFAAWINPVSYPASGSFIDIISTANSYLANQLSMNSNGYICNRTRYIYFSVQYTEYCQDSGPKVLPDQWNYVVLTNNGGNKGSVYINGALAQTIDMTPKATVSPGTISVGMPNGQIDEARIYGKALTSAEISALYINGGYVADTNPGREYVLNALSVTFGNWEPVVGFNPVIWNGDYSPQTLDTIASTLALAAPKAPNATRISETQITINNWTDTPATNIDKTGLRVFRCYTALGGCGVAEPPCDSAAGITPTCDSAAGKGWWQVGPDQAASATTYTDSTVVPNRAYLYRIGAFKTMVPPVNSWAIQGALSSSITSPITPPSGLVCVKNNTTKVTCSSWTNNSPTAAGYRFYRCEDSATACTPVIAPASPNGYVGFVAPTTVTSFIDNSACSNKTYRYVMTSYGTVNGTAWESGASNKTSAVLTDSIVRPSGLRAAVVSAGNIKLEWTDTNADESGFKIERCTPTSGVCTGNLGIGVDDYTQIATPTATNDTNTLPAASLYCYRVRAYKGSTCGWDTDYSNGPNDVCIPGAPSGITATQVEPFKIKLEWADTSFYEDRFEIEKQITNLGWALFDTVGAGVKTYTHTHGIEPLKTYNYRIRAVRGNIYSDYGYLSPLVTTPAYNTNATTCP